MINVRQGGPGEIEVEIREEKGQVAYGKYLGPVDPENRVYLWLDPSRALDLAERLKDIVQAMDDAKREREP